MDFARNLSSHQDLSLPLHNGFDKDDGMPVGFEKSHKSSWQLVKKAMSCCAGVAAIIYLILLLPMTLKHDWKPSHCTRPLTIEQRVTKILAENPLIDGHDDFAMIIRWKYQNQIYGDNFTKSLTQSGLPGHVDLPRLKKGQVGGSFWAAFAPCPKNHQDFSDETYIPTVGFTYSQLDMLARLQAEFPMHFSPPGNGSSAIAYFNEGKMISPLAIEGLHQIGNSVATLRNYFALGIRYATLTHNCHNIYADSALSDLPEGGSVKAKPYWGGVSKAGQKLIKEMNRLGLIVDISHVSQDTMIDVLGAGEDGWSGSVAPVIFSHSSAYTLCPHPRNVPDDILKLVKKKNGVVMVNFAPDFISCVEADPPNDSGLPDFVPANATLETVADHIMHIGQLIGYDHVGVGSDFDGIPSVPKDLEDVSKFPSLFAELLRRGVSDGDAVKIAGGNVLRVWAAVDAVAADLQAEGVLPLEDEIDEM